MQFSEKWFDPEGENPEKIQASEFDSYRMQFTNSEGQAVYINQAGKVVRFNLDGTASKTEIDKLLEFQISNAHLYDLGGRSLTQQRFQEDPTRILTRKGVEHITLPDLGDVGYDDKMNTQLAKWVLSNRDYLSDRDQQSLRRFKKEIASPDALLAMLSGKSMRDTVWTEMIKPMLKSRCHFTP